MEHPADQLRGISCLADSPPQTKARPSSREERQGSWGSTDLLPLAVEKSLGSRWPGVGMPQTISRPDLENYRFAQVLQGSNLPPLPRLSPRHIDACCDRLNTPHRWEGGDISASAWNFRSPPVAFTSTTRLQDSTRSPFLAPVGPRARSI